MPTLATPLTTDIPEFNWIPPLWDDDNTIKPDLTKDPLNQLTAPQFTKPSKLNGALLLAPRITALKTAFPGIIDDVKGTRNTESEPNADTGAELNMVPHPSSDFSHIDPGTYTKEGPDSQQAQILKAIQAVRDLLPLADKDETLKESLDEALLPLNRAESALIKAPRRLTLIFENNLCKVTVLYGEMGTALEKPDQTGRTAYAAARAEYMKLLEDLDDSEPTQFVAGKSGYGRAFKWSYMRPLIHEGKIKGAKVMAKWNPHKSSSGIPIPHT